MAVDIDCEPLHISMKCAGIGVQIKANPLKLAEKMQAEKDDVSRSEDLAKFVADALKEHLLVVVRGDVNDEDGSCRRSMTPAQMRIVYSHVHESRYPGLTFSPPPAPRPGWSENNLRGATFSGFNGIYNKRQELLNHYSGHWIVFVVLH